MKIFDTVRIKKTGELAKLLDIVPIYGSNDKRYLVELLKWPEGATLHDILFDYSEDELEEAAE